MTTNISGLTRGKAEPLVERHAWKVLLVVSLIIGFFGVSDMLGGGADLQQGESALMHSLTGMSWEELREANPPAAHLIEWKFRTDGAALLTIALLSLIVCLADFRKGQRWAWYALWALPLWLLLTVVFTWAAVQYPGYGTPVPILSGSILLALWVAFHALSYPKFFLKERR